MSATSREVRISHWCNPAESAGRIRVNEVGHNSQAHPELQGRITLALDLGVSTTVHLRPTVAEVRELIAALQWAMHARDAARDVLATEAA